MKLKLTEDQYGRLFEDNDTKSYKVLKNIFERRFDLSFPHSEGTSYEYDTLIKDKETNISYSEYEMDGITLPMIDLIEIISDLTGFDDNFIEIFLNKYIETEFEKKDYYGYNKLNEQQTDKSYEILKKYFNRHFDLMHDEYGTYVLYRDKEDDEDSTDFKFYVDEEGWYGVLADIQATTGFDKDVIENFIISYSDELYRNEEEGLYEEKSDEKLKRLLIKLMKDRYGYYTRTGRLYDKEDDFTVNLNDIVSYLVRTTGYEKQRIFNITKDFIDNKTNFITEEIKINRTPNLLNVKIIEGKEDIGEITFESSDGIEYTIIDAKIKPEFRNKGFYKKAIIDILKKYPDIKIVSIFRSDDADKAWNSLIEKLPPEFKVEKKEHEAEKTKEYKLSLNEGLDSDKRSKIIIKYLLQDFEPVMAIDPYKFTEKVIFFYKEDAEREEDYELYLWDNQSHIVTMVSIISNVTGYDRSIVHDVIQKYIKNINKRGMKYINEGISDKLTNKIVNKLLDKYNVDYKNNLLHFYTKDNNRINGDKVYNYICDIIGVNEDYELEKADEIYNEFIKKTLQGKSINEGVSDDKIKNLLIKLIDKNYEYDGYGISIRNKSTKDYINYSTISSFLSKITGYNMGYIRYLIKDYLDNDMKLMNEAEIDADGNLIDFDYEEETDAEFETSNFSFILDKVENGEVYGDFTFKKIDLRFPIVMKPEGDTYRIGFPDDNIEQDFMGAANHFRLGKEYNQFIRHILNTLLK